MISSSTEGTYSNISEIVEGRLYLGDQYSATNHKKLAKLGITHILNMTREIQYSKKRKITYLRICIEDGIEGVGKHFDKAIQFIDRGKVVLVHCKEGISRSASMVIAYLMKVNHWGFDRTFDFVKGKREVVNPHFNFQVELLNHQKGLKIESKGRKRKLSQGDYRKHEITQVPGNKKKRRALASKT